jgi:lysophospholipase L1-like esterase
MRREWVLFLAAFLGALLLAEGFVRAYYTLGRKVPPHRDDSLSEEWKWASEHLAAGAAYLPGQAVYDPTLGWTTKPNLHLADVRTNSAGMRSDREFTRESTGPRRILFIGDSYTFGAHIADHEAFPAVLQETYLPDWEVLNFGVPGYGPDQILLRYETVGTQYRPDVVVFGFYPRGFFRLFTRFRFYAKPYFVIDASGALTLKNVPVQTPEELYALFESGTRRIGGWTNSYLLGLLGSRVAQTFGRRRIDDRADESWGLMAAILRRFRDRATEAGSQPFLLIFPTRPGDNEDSVYQDLDRLAQLEASALGLPFLSLAKGFAVESERHPGKPLFRKRAAGGHLSAHGNRLVAKLLSQSLEEEGLTR